jgi:hypothetical protein
MLVDFIYRRLLRLVARSFLVRGRSSSTISSAGTRSALHPSSRSLKVWRANSPCASSSFLRLDYRNICALGEGFCCIQRYPRIQVCDRQAILRSSICIFYIVSIVAFGWLQLLGQISRLAFQAGRKRRSVGAVNVGNRILPYGRCRDPVDYLPQRRKVEAVTAVYHLRFFWWHTLSLTASAVA